MDVVFHPTDPPSFTWDQLKRLPSKKACQMVHPPVLMHSSLSRDHFDTVNSHVCRKKKEYPTELLFWRIDMVVDPPLYYFRPGFIRIREAFGPLP